MKYLLHPHEIDADCPVGGKAGALAALTREGFPVPDFCVLLPNAFHASLDADVHEALRRAESAADFHRLLAGVRLSGAPLIELETAVSDLCPNGETLAIRSSALEEDGALHSFAGQLESFLFVEAGDVADRVSRVWRSAFGERSLSYRRQARLDSPPAVPAVLIQRMVEGDVSGVAFSADPVAGRRSACVVTAVWGLGAALASGEVESDTWTIDALGNVIESQIAKKPTTCRRDLGNPAGVSLAPAPGPQVSQSTLTDLQAFDVATLARRAAGNFGRPQDIEWTLRDGKLHLLQSRPITTLASIPDPDGIRRIWDNSNIIESYGGVTTPFTFSFASRAYEGVYRQFCRVMRVPEGVILQNEEIFPCMIGIVRGRVYYNLLNCYRLLTMLPGFRLNRALTEQMLGIREELPTELSVELDRVAVGARLKDALHLVRTLWGTVLNFFRLSSLVRGFYARVEAALAAGRADLERLPAEDLAARYRGLEQKLLRHWDAPVLNDFFLTIFHGVLKKLTARWIRDETGTLQNDLLCGEGALLGHEAAERMRHMAQLASRRPDVVDALCASSRVVIDRALRAMPELESAYRDYVERLGERCLEELKLESPTLHDDPMPLLRSVGHHAQCILAGSPQSTDHATKLRQQSEARALQTLRSNPIKRWFFRWVLANTRRQVRERENLRFERTRVFGLARRIALEMGRRLSAHDLLADPHDIFFLRVDEMLSIVEGTAVSTDLRGLVDFRRSEYDRYRTEQEPASRFETRGIVYVGEQHRGVLDNRAPDGESTKGIGCCSGIVRGRVRFVTDPASARLEPGDIAVAERTDPGWVMIFPSISGLLVERGSALSHSAIVAREIGLPTIVAVPNLTAWLEDGEWVEMNGGTGEIVKVPQTGVSDVE